MNRTISYSRVKVGADAQSYHAPDQTFEGRSSLPRGQADRPNLGGLVNIELPRFTVSMPLAGRHAKSSGQPIEQPVQIASQVAPCFHKVASPH